MEFHEKLQQLRKQQNLTQEQLAEQLFVSRTAVSKWEPGRFILAGYWGALTALIILGVLGLILQRRQKERWSAYTAKAAFGLDMFAVCMFAATQQPYATTLLLAKVFVFAKCK